MSDSFGACVVLLPGPNSLPNELEGGQHITLAYFGDEALSDALFQDLLDIVSDLSRHAENNLAAEINVVGDDFFGPEGTNPAHVLILDPTPSSPAVVLRKHLLHNLSPELLSIFLKAETFPQYRPHMTLGYLSEIYEPTQQEFPDILPLSSIAVWNGDTRVEFLMEPMAHNSLAHYGILRKSGRYAWGSGETPHQRNIGFLDSVEELRRQGLSEVEIAKGMDVSTTQLRAAKAIAKNEARRADAVRALSLKEKGMSNVAIGANMGINESSVRALLDPAVQARNSVLVTTANMLKDQVAEKKYLDIGSGTSNHLAISPTMLNTSVAMLREEGYTLHYVKVEQLGTGKQTTLKVLAPPDTPYSEVFRNPDQIKNITPYTDDGGVSYKPIQPPISVSSKRVGVRYAEAGGGDADGVIYIRPNVKDLGMGNARYAQVRIAVDGTHYLKGMAMYKDDLPAGVDLMFNTNKSPTGNKLDALKKMTMDPNDPTKMDPDNPFGSVVRQLDQYGGIIRQITKPDGTGPGKVASALNIVNDESDWDDWSRNLASQMLSKQPPALAKQQLALKSAQKQAEFDEIMSLTNPAVRKKLLDSYADSADSSSVHLKAAALPRQKTHVILPINSLKDDEIYAPQYRNGEQVVLIRYPHGGTFEIPELTVNNRNVAARKAIGPDAKAAVGINARVAERLSGADFDGDTVIVIPNNSRQVKTSAPLEGLVGFNPKEKYKAYEGMKAMTPRAKQQEMGNVSNLITDMTIKGAPNSEIVRAVRHSMVVIDAEKHTLNYKQSAIDNGIVELKRKYQPRPDGSAGGAATIISRSSSDIRVPDRTPRKAKDGGPIDKATGAKVFVDTGDHYVIPAHTKMTKTGKIVDVPEKTVYTKTKSKKMSETSDAHTLTSGPVPQRIEEIYADHANKLKSMANAARKASYETPPILVNASAKKVYANDVAALNAKLNLALKNSPRERQAQLLANAQVKAKRQANPDMEASEVKKIKGLALQEARDRVGAKKPRIEITPSEWDAIQAGAISNNKLNQILSNADLEKVKQLAMPRINSVMSGPVTARAKAMSAAGYTNSEISDQLGVPTSTLNDALTR